MPAHSWDTIIVRFGGEIGIKAIWTRKQYERHLTQNIKAVLKHYNLTYSAFIKKAGRLYIKTDKPEEASRKLSKVFGVSSLSPAAETSSELHNILDTSLQVARTRFKPRKTFAVRCRRVGEHAYTSQDICEKAGDLLRASLPELKLRVNLTRPQQTLHIEVREERAYVFTEIINGVGGLPLGTQPKLVCLIEGDARSAVACWMTMKRGCPPVLVHFQETSQIKKANIKEAKTAARKLMDWNFGFVRRLHVIENESFSKKRSLTCSDQLINLLVKRLILRVSRLIAEETHAEGIVVGDTIESDASHSIHAFRLQDEAVVDYPVYRPLIGLDAAEIEKTAKLIGFKKASNKRAKKRVEPRTAEANKLDLETLHKAENEVNMKRLVERALKSHRVVTL